MVLLIIIVMSALTVSALCSVLEATLLSVSVVSLNQRKDQGDKKAARLLDLKLHKRELSIGAILTYNTIAHTIGAALSGAQAAQVFGDNWVGLFSGVLTVLILIATEIIPKTIGTVYADRLVGFVGLMITIMILPPMKWILWLTHGMTNLFIGKRKKKVMTRGEVLAAVRMATRDGSLAEHEAEALGNLLRFREIRLEDIMTPRTVMVAYRQSTLVDKILADDSPRAFSRIPLYDQNHDDVLGYVLMRDLLRAAVDGGGQRRIADFRRPIIALSEEASVGEALSAFTEKREQIAVVLEPHGGVAGIVTLEDCIETALGHEIVDEIDRVADLREVALGLRDKRLARMQAKQAEIAAASRPPEPNPPEAEAAPPPTSPPDTPA